MDFLTTIITTLVAFTVSHYTLEKYEVEAKLTRLVATVFAVVVLVALLTDKL